MTIGIQGWGHPPGQDVLRETIDNTLWWGATPDNVLILPRKIDSGVTDPGNTGNTNILRAGLMLAIDATSDTTRQTLYAYARGSATADLAHIAAILAHSVDVTKYGTAADLWVGVIVGGPLVAKRLINPTSGDDNTVGGWVGGANDAAIRASLESSALASGQYRFILDDFDVNG